MNAQTTGRIAGARLETPRFIRAAMTLFGLTAAVSMVLQEGFPIGSGLGRWLNWLDVFLAAGFAVGLLAEVSRSKRRREILHRRRADILILCILIFALGLVWALPRATVAGWASLFHQATAADFAFSIVQLFLLANVSIQILRALQRVFEMAIRLELLLGGSFAAVILVGALLLLMPLAKGRVGTPISILDALFTSTSAVCVTGLVVRDPGMDYSTLGQMIIMSLFQIGGLGIGTFVAFISVFSARTLPIPQMAAFRQMFSASAMDDMKRRIAGIVVLTLLIEGAGAASLYAAVPRSGDVFNHVKWAVFHSVSAFCNAGFALQTDSLEFARTDVAVNMTIMCLIVLGGLGFLVLPELLAVLARSPEWLPLALRRRADRFRRAVPPRLTIQTRISLNVTFVLIVAGFLGFWWLERGHLLHGMAAGDSLLASAFQSITARTAGFNTVPVGDLQQATLILIIVLMVIGGCPVSTAGGIKTVTFGVLILALRSMLYERQNVEAFRRTLPARAFFTALNVAVLYAVTAVTCVFLLAVFDPQLGLRDTTFEVVSALSTVGLSTGITAGLSAGSKLVLCAAMFIGRVGPIALVLSVFQSRGKVEYEYPTEDVVVG